MLNKKINTEKSFFFIENILNNFMYSKTNSLLWPQVCDPLVYFIFVSMCFAEYSNSKSSLSFVARKYSSASATVRAQITPSSSLNPKSRDPITCSTPTSPKAKPVTTEATNWNIARVCFSNILTKNKHFH